MENVNNLDKGFNVSKLNGLFYSILEKFEINTYAKEAGIFNYTNVMHAEGEYVKNNRILLATYLVKNFKYESGIYSILTNLDIEIVNLLEQIKLFLKINTLNRLGKANSIDGVMDEVETSYLPEYIKTELMNILGNLKKIVHEANKLGLDIRTIAARNQEENK